MHDPRFDPLPTGEIARVRRLARDLAWGVMHEDWGHQFIEQRDRFIVSSEDSELGSYLEKVWGKSCPRPSVLKILGYLQYLREIGVPIDVYSLTDKAFLLLEESSPSSVFISYARRESSALALLIVARFKEHGLSPFLDMHPDGDETANKLALGDDWQTKITKAIEERDHFIVLIGPTSLNSPHVQQEIAVAVENKKHVIPIWHNGFGTENAGHIPTDLPMNIREAVSGKHASRVEGENPKQYNATLDELLAEFGIAP